MLMAMPQCAIAHCGSSFAICSKFFFRFLIPERVQQRDAALKRLLHLAAHDIGKCTMPS